MSSTGFNLYDESKKNIDNQRFKTQLKHQKVEQRGFLKHLQAPVNQTLRA